MVRVLLVCLLLACALEAHARRLQQNGQQVRICVPYDVNDDFLSACTAAVSAADTSQVSFSCVAGGTAEACAKMIADGEAEATKLGATEMYVANRDQGLVPIVSENYGDLVGATYYSVAIVPKEFCTAGVTLASLRGKRSCHTGYRRTAGWTMPIGYLSGAGVMPTVGGTSGVEVDAQSAAAFFSATCAPSQAGEGPAANGAQWDELCTGCRGDCTDESPYWDYPGSLRCLMEGAGDVAFTKHDTALIYTTDGSNPAPWASKSKDDLRLVCGDGGCATVDQFRECNLAIVPAQAIVAAPDLPKVSQIKQALVSAANNASSTGAFLRATTEILGQQNFLFSRATTGVQAVDGSFQQYYTPAAMAAVSGTLDLQARGAGVAASESSGSSGLSGGAIAGIVIGCLAAVAIAAAAFVVWKKKRAPYAFHNDSKQQKGIMDAQLKSVEWQAQP